MSAGLQLALDGEFGAAQALVRTCMSAIDTLEVGTPLLMRRGVEAIAWVRDQAPTHRIVADARITEAGGPIAEILFGAGADVVTVNWSAGEPTLRAVAAVAARTGGSLQIELGDRYTLEDLHRWRDVGVRDVIVHRSRDAEQGGWGPSDVATISWLSEFGFSVSVTGGLGLSETRYLRDSGASNYIIGRAITHAPDPAGAAREFREAMGAPDRSEASVAADETVLESGARR